MSRRAFQLVAVCAALQGLSCSDAAPSSNQSGGRSGADGTETGTGADGSGGDAGGTAPSGGVMSGGSSSSDAASDFGAAFCHAARTCCDGDGFDWMGLQDCESEAERQFDVLEGVKRGTVVVQSGLAACVAELEQLADRCVLDSATLAVCNSSFSGTVDAGGQCVTVLDCKRDEKKPVACIRVNSDGVTAPNGVCRPLEAAQLGEACLVSVSELPYGITYGASDPNPPLTYCDVAAGLYCSRDTATCAAQGAAAASCETHQSCQSGLVCVETCQRPKQLGDACISSSECSPPARCAEGKCAVPRFASAALCGGDLN